MLHAILALSLLAGSEIYAGNELYPDSANAFGGGVFTGGLEVTDEGVCTSPNSVVFDVNGNASCAPASDLPPGDIMMHAAHSFPEGTQDPSDAYAAGGLGPRYVEVTAFGDSTDGTFVVTATNCSSGVCSISIKTYTESINFDCDPTGNNECSCALFDAMAADLPTGIFGVTRTDGTCTDSKVFLTPALGTIALKIAQTDGTGGAWATATNSTDGNVIFPIGQILTAGGLTTLPKYSFILDPDTGMYRAASNTIGWSTGSIARMTLSNAALSMFALIQMGTRNIYSANGPLRLCGDFTTIHGLTSGDGGCSGDFEVTGVSWLNGLVIGSSGVNVPDNQVFSVGAVQDTRFRWSTTQTPDSAQWMLSASGRVINIIELADGAIDFAIPNPTNPTLCLQSSDATDITQRGCFTHDQTDFVITPVSGAVKVAGDLIVTGSIAGGGQDGAMGVTGGAEETIDVTAVDHVVTTFVTGATTDVGWTFAANDTGPISAMTTSGGGSAVNCADTGHGLVTGDVVNITDALTGGNGAYNGVHVIIRIDDDNFTIPVAYNADESGTNWKRGDRLIADAGSAGDYEITFGATTIMAGTNVHMLGRVYVNGVAQTASFLIFERFHSNNDTGYAGMNGNVTIAVGDEVFVTIQNMDDATNATLKHASFTIDRD